MTLDEDTRRGCRRAEGKKQMAKEVAHCERAYRVANGDLVILDAEQRSDGANVHSGITRCGGTYANLSDVGASHLQEFIAVSKHDRNTKNGMISLTVTVRRLAAAAAAAAMTTI